MVIIIHFRKDENRKIFSPIKKGKIYVDSMASLIFYVNFKLIVLQKG